MIVGSKVKLLVETDNEIYSYQIPPQGSIGIIKELGTQQMLKLLFDINVPFHLVEFETGEEVSIYEHDLKMVFEKS